MKVGDLSLSFKRYALHERGIRPNSYKAIVSAINRLAKFSKTENINHLDTSVVREFLYYGREEFLWSPKTFRNMRQCLASYFNFCIKFGHLKKNPTDEIDKPKLPQALPRSLTQEQAKIILAYTLDHKWYYEIERIRNYAIIMTFLHTGLRLSELINLQTKDIDLHNKQIFVRLGKNQKDRIVPISTTLARNLKQYQEERRLKLSSSLYFFTSVRSPSKLTPKNIQIICRKISKESQTKFTPHMLRHTFARTCVENDMNLFKLMKILGHTNLETTQRYLVFKLFF